MGALLHAVSGGGIRSLVDRYWGGGGRDHLVPCSSAGLEIACLIYLPSTTLALCIKKAVPDGFACSCFPDQKKFSIPDIPTIGCWDLPPNKICSNGFGLNPYPVSYMEVSRGGCRFPPPRYFKSPSRTQSSFSSSSVPRTTSPLVRSTVKIAVPYGIERIPVIRYGRVWTVVQRLLLSADQV